MKIFIYTPISERFKKKHRTEVTVYQIVKNRPKYIGIIEWNPSSFSGEQTTIMEALVRLGKLPKQYERGYYNDHTNKNFEILSV